MLPELNFGENPIKYHYNLVELYKDEAKSLLNNEINDFATQKNMLEINILRCEVK